MIPSTDQARVSSRQHRTPCHDCPFARKAISGWLGGNTPQQFIAMAQSDEIYHCHSFTGPKRPQCAGLAIFRANICKEPRDPKALRLRPNIKLVFSWPLEFMKHHMKGIGGT